MAEVDPGDWLLWARPYAMVAAAITQELAGNSAYLALPIHLSVDRRSGKQNLHKCKLSASGFERFVWFRSIILSLARGVPILYQTTFLN